MNRTFAISRGFIKLLGLALSVWILSACGANEPQTALPETDETPAPASSGTLTLYSGRSESLVGPLLEQFEAESGIEVEVRWGGTAELATLLIQEGADSPADVFYAQDPGGMGAVIDLLARLPDELFTDLDPRFYDPGMHWAGVSGRARVIVYNTDNLTVEDLPADLQALTDPAWQGRIGWAPGNASLQTMITAMREIWGEDDTRQWLEGFVANQPLIYDGNTAVVAAVGAGEVDLGLVNHYYLYRFLAEEGEAFPARNHFLDNGGPGSLVMTSGAGVLAASPNQEAGQALIRFLLSEQAQTYFREETYEYPLSAGVAPVEALPDLQSLPAPDISVSALADLEGTVALMREAGALP